MSVAQYESKCAACGVTIRVGDQIVPTDLSEATSDSPFKPWWEHASCPPGKLDITRGVCSGCFTEKSVDGSCLCGAL